MNEPKGGCANATGRESRHAGLSVVPCTIRAAREWVAQYHRTHKSMPGGLFAAAVAIDGVWVGVGVAARPCRLLQDGRTTEIRRVATDGHRNACSKLYGALRGAAAMLGYRRVITYTLADEPGTSLRAAGFVDMGLTAGGSYDRPSRRRSDKHPTGPKRRWVWERP